MEKNTTKQKPSGYWDIYENNYKEAQKYNSRSEFAKGCSGAYNVARKNGWLDNYTWFILTNELQKISQTKWTYETCNQEAQKYNSRIEFVKGNGSAYQVALKNGWLDNYTWFISTNELQKISQTKWTYETCNQEARKYNSRKEFQKGCNSAYNVALKNGWLDNYTWFISTNELMKLKLTKWTYETCYQEAKKYNSRSEFSKGCSGAYQVALKNGWLDNYIWFEKDLDPYKNKKHIVYCYIDENNVYVGITMDAERRHKEHSTDEQSPIYKLAKQNNKPIPQMTKLETNLSIEEAREKEDFYVTKFKKEGWNVLNKAKTGKNCGSLGGLNNGKWNKKTCYQEAQKYNSRIEFQKGNGSAYNVARKNGWLDNYIWFKEKKKCDYWTYETCYQEAKNYNSRSEFAKGCGSAYKVACENNWLDNYTWFISTNELQKISQTKWSYETCNQEARKYNSRKEFQNGCGGAYNVARKNGWIDNYTWFISRDELMKLKLTKWTYEICYQEAKKYNSRNEFKKGCGSAYHTALKNSWLDNYTWLTRPKHHNIKWTYETCNQEAQKYNSRIEFQKGNCSAYNVARKNGWLDNYTWFIEKQKPSGYWNNYENNYNEALKYKSRTEFQKGCKGAYRVACKKGWLDIFFPKGK